MKNFLSTFRFLVYPILVFALLVMFGKSGFEVSSIEPSPFPAMVVLFLVSLVLFFLQRVLPIFRLFAGKEIPVLSLAGVFLYLSLMGIERKALGGTFIVLCIGWFLCWRVWKWLSNLEEKICSKHSRKEQKSELEKRKNPSN